MKIANGETMGTLILVRHGHVEGIEPSRFRGRTELALTPRGEREALAVRDRIASVWRPSIIFSSPMGRCRRTAERIAQAFHLHVRVEPELNDIDYGQWHGLTPDEVHAQWPDEVALWYAAPHRVAIPSGESLQDVATRVARLLRRIVHEHAGQTVVAVGHDSVNRVILLDALDLPLSRYWCITQAPAAIDVIDFEEHRLSVRTLNETQHLAVV
jgi:probable phosphoglycerate mutase